MTLLYICADKIGTPTGGGQVTYHELEALKQLGEVKTVSIDHSKPPGDPFHQDLEIMNQIRHWNAYGSYMPRLAHCYAGCLDETVRYLHSIGCKVTYTAAAHDVEASRREHESLGMGYNYPHLTQPDLLDRYLGGYREADVVICPSRYSERIMRRFGCTQVVVIPHGCQPVAEVKPLPKQFVVGYLGQPGPDKGLQYLFAAWKKLNYPDSRLVVAGPHTEMLHLLVRAVGGGNVYLAGFVPTPSWLYNRCSVYVQCSVTEGFGMEVLEAMSHGRPVICSSGAGAVDFVEHHTNGIVVEPGNPEALALAIDFYKSHPEQIARHGQNAVQTSRRVTWESVRSLYQETWRKLCDGVSH